MTSIMTPIYNSPFDDGESRSAENPDVPLNSAIFEDYDGYGLKTTSGVRVSRRKALGCPACLYYIRVGRSPSCSARIWAVTVFDF